MECLFRLRGRPDKTGQHLTPSCRRHQSLLLASDLQALLAAEGQALLPPCCYTRLPPPARKEAFEAPASCSSIHLHTPHEPSCMRLMQVFER